jgi:hypothetical protein
MVGNNGSVLLTIYSYQWINEFEVDFITNNPIGDNFNSFFKAMPAARLLNEQQASHHRLLGSNMNLNY